MALMWNRTVDWDADDWRRSAACRNTEPDLFFPVGTTGPAVDQIEAAKRVCRSCEALEPCLDFALATNQESGVWGGTSEEERRKLRKAWLAARRSQRAASELSVRQRHRLARALRPGAAHRGARTGTEIATRVPPPSAAGTGSMEIVPSSWLTTRSRTMESPRLVVRSMSNPSGRPEPVVAHLDAQRRLLVRQREVDVAHRRVAGGAARPLESGRPVAASGGLGIEGVLDGVLQQLGHRHRQRRGHVGRHLAEVPVHRDHDRLRRHHRVLGHLHQRGRRSRRRAPGRSGRARGSRAPGRSSAPAARPRAARPVPPGPPPGGPGGSAATRSSAGCS